VRTSKRSSKGSKKAKPTETHKARDTARKHLIANIAKHAKVSRRRAQRLLMLFELESKKKLTRKRKTTPARRVYLCTRVSATRLPVRKASKHEGPVALSSVLKAFGKEYEAWLVGK
jgi:hypothetical protein